MKLHFLIGSIFFAFVIAGFVVIEVFGVKMDFIGGVIIGLLSGQILPAWKYFFKTEHKNPRIVPCSQKPIFHAGIMNNNGNYIQGSVNITFKSEYIGKLKNGYFVNEITFPENNGGNMFSTTIPNPNGNFSSARSLCRDTIDIPNSRKGKLNGWRQFSFIWNWNIPFQEDMPLGEYRVNCMVFNENEEKPIDTKPDSFIVVNRPNNSHVNNTNFIIRQPESD